MTLLSSRSLPLQYSCWAVTGWQRQTWTLPEDSSMPKEKPSQTSMKHSFLPAVMGDCIHNTALLFREHKQSLLQAILLRLMLTVLVLLIYLANIIRHITDVKETPARLEEFTDARSDMQPDASCFAFRFVMRWPVAKCRSIYSTKEITVTSYNFLLHTFL